MTYNQNLGTQSVFNMTLPNVPMVVPQQADFSAQLAVEFDLTPLIDKGSMDFISGVWVDNFGNDNPVILIVSGTNQRIVFPGNAQAYFPVLAPDRPKFTLTCAVDPGFPVPIEFHNVPLLPYINYAGGLPITVDPANPLVTEIKAPAITKSVITLDGTSQQIVAANEAAQYLLIYNPVGSANVNIDISGGDATDGFTLIAGGSYEKAVSGLSNSVTAKGTNGETLIVWKG